MSTLRVDNVTDLGDDPVVTAGVVAGGALPAGSILQVVSTTKTDTFSASVAQGAFSPVTGLSASITPSSTSSKILIMATISTGEVSTSASATYRLMRGATAIDIGDAASNRTPASGANSATGTFANEQMNTGSVLFLDSPATTSATTYSIEVGHTRGATVSVFVNRTNADGDVSYIPRTSSTITLMEVAG